MFEADPLATIQIANDATQLVLQAGPPAELPSQVPGFVSELLNEIGSAAGGIGETISGMTPGGSEAAEGADRAAGAADAASGK